MINKVTLIGRLGKDPEKKTLPNGASYVRFTMATSESYKDKDGEWKDQTEWHNIIMWRDLADRAEKQLKKGSLVYLEGKLTTQSWQDQDGKTNYRTEVAVNTFRSLEKREGGNYENFSPAPVESFESNIDNSFNQKSSKPTSKSVEEEDDLPF
jgi:single-strand DNA-binding protein